MKKYFGTTWVEWICIFVAAFVANIATDSYKTEWYWRMVIFGISWFLAFTLTYLLIYQILKWTGKN